jgi:hypothetical protein
MTQAEVHPGKAKLAQFLSIPRGLRGMNLKTFAEKELGVTEQTLHKWKKDPDVINRMKSKIYHEFFYSLPDVMEAMRSKAIAGDTQAARIFLDFIMDNRPHSPQLHAFTIEETKALVSRLEKANLCNS